MGIWYEIYCRCSDYLTLRGVGIWETEASAVERLCKAKYRTKIDCKITWHICVLLAKLRQGGGGGNFQVVSQRQNMSTFFFAQFAYEKLKKLGRMAVLKQNRMLYILFLVLEFWAANQ